MELEVVNRGGCILQSTFSMCTYAENTPTHGFTTAAKSSAFWSSCLRCAWSSQNLDLPDLVLFLKVLKVL